MSAHLDISDNSQGTILKLVEVMFDLPRVKLRKLGGSFKRWWESLEETAYTCPFETSKYLGTLISTALKNGGNIKFI